jgi:DNA-binding XRE family transcriptional regulator
MRTHQACTNDDDAGQAATFNRHFCERVRALRHASKMTQAAMASALGITSSAYEKYETRSPLPHWLISRFIEVTGVNIDKLFISDKSSGDKCPARR